MPLMKVALIALDRILPVQSSTSQTEIISLTIGDIVSSQKVSARGS